MRIPTLARAHIVGEFRPPDRRRRDVANLYPSFKAAIDGLVDAAVLVDDDDTHLVGPDMRLGGLVAGGQIVLHITELLSEVTP
jgi:Holliday junction resolvase RusA-like endonuclease